jgi:hypothetical protein
VIVREPHQLRTRLIVELHPVLLEGFDPKDSFHIDIELSYFKSIKAAPSSAYLFQPPLDDITIEHYGRFSRLQVSGGVTFAAVLQQVENTQTAAKDAVLHGPHSAQCRGGRRLVDEWGFYIRADQAVANNAEAVMDSKDPRVEESPQIIPEDYKRSCNIAEGLQNGDLDLSAFAETQHQPHSHDSRLATTSHDDSSTQKLQGLHNKEAMHESEKAVHVVVGTISHGSDSGRVVILVMVVVANQLQPKLLIMVWSALSTKDLTRCLTVSKHWRDMILHPKSKKLHRILFLESVPPQTRAYLDFRHDTDRRCYMDKSKSRKTSHRERAR